MSGDIKQFLEAQRLEILQEKKRLDLVEKLIVEGNKENLIKPPYDANLYIKQAGDQNCNSSPWPVDLPECRGEKENLGGKKRDDANENDKENENFPRDSQEKRLGKSPEGVLRWCAENNAVKDKEGNLKVENVPSVIEPLDLSRCYELSLEERKQALIERLANSEGPFSYRSSNEATGLGVLGGGAPFGLPLLRRGEYAPLRHPHLRAAPHEGLGEYEIRRSLKVRKHRDYLGNATKKNQSCIKEVLTDKVETQQSQDSPKSTSASTNTELSVDSKSVQTDIQNINNELVVKHDLRLQPTTTRDVALSPPRTATDELVDAVLRRRSPYRHHVDQRLTSAQDELLLRASSTGGYTAATMDKPKSILSNRRTGSPRDRYTSDLGHSSYTPTTFMDGFSYSDRSDELERERLKREAYQHELRLQIEEKRHLAALRDDQERRERELENRRLEQQLLRMREEQAQEDQRRQRRNELMRRHSDDLLRRKTELHELQRPWRRHADSESANLDSLGLGTSPSAYGPLGGYSPPVSRRGLAPASPYSSSYNVPATSVFPDSSASRYNPSRFDSSSYPGGILRKPESSALRRMESLNSYDTVPLPRGHRAKFDRFDSLSRIDSLSHRLETMSVRDGFSSDLSDLQRRHSATQQDLSLSRSPRLRRRNSSSRFEDSLPIPVLKARSPVAKELRNAVPFSSHRSSDAHRRLEDRWQIPAVQKNILHPASTSLESPVGSRGSILTQLGSIRAQLQREQLRMDETLRRRGLLRTRTTEDY